MSSEDIVLFVNVILKMFQNNNNNNNKCIYYSITVYINKINKIYKLIIN